MDRRRVGQHQLVQLAEVVGDLAAVERDDQLALLHVDAGDHAEIAVEHLPVVVVPTCITLSPGPKVQPNRSTLALAGRVQRLLQLDVQ